MLVPVIGARSQIPPKIADHLPRHAVDTGYVNLDKDRISLRIFTVIKNQGFRIKYMESGLKYTDTCLCRDKAGSVIIYLNL